MNIDELQVGRDTDVLVAETVMKWDVYRYQKDNYVIVHCDGDDVHCYHLEPDDVYMAWEPSSRLRDAWVVVDYLIEYAHSFELQWLGATYGWWCKISGECAKARTPELAICRAALKAMSASDKQ